MDQTYSVAALVSPPGSEIIFRDNNELFCVESHTNLRYEMCQKIFALQKNMLCTTILCQTLSKQGNEQTLYYGWVQTVRM